MLFIQAPNDPQTIAASSKQFFAFEFERSKAQVMWAERQLQRAEDEYEATSGTAAWQVGCGLNNLQDLLDEAKTVHEANVKRLAWEKESNWKRKFPKPHPLSFPRPWLTDQKNWLKNFKR